MGRRVQTLSNVYTMDVLDGMKKGSREAAELATRFSLLSPHPPAPKFCAFCALSWGPHVLPTLDVLESLPIESVDDPLRLSMCRARIFFFSRANFSAPNFLHSRLHHRAIRTLSLPPFVTHGPCYIAGVLSSALCSCSARRWHSHNTSRCTTRRNCHVAPLSLSSLLALVRKLILASFRMLPRDNGRSWC